VTLRKDRTVSLLGPGSRRFAPRTPVAQDASERLLNRLDIPRKPGLHYLGLGLLTASLISLPALQAETTEATDLLSTSSSATQTIPQPTVALAAADLNAAPLPQTVQAALPAIASETRPAAVLANPPAPAAPVAVPAANTAAAPAPAPPSALTAPAILAAAPVPAGPLRPALAWLLDFSADRGIPESPYGDKIYEIASRYSLNPHLVAAMIHVESAFNPKARSRKGACGLMQLLPDTARRFGVGKREIFDPNKNLEAGVRYIKWLSDRFNGDPVRVLAAYNAGEGAVERHGGVPPYQETQNYVRRIFGLLGLDPASDAAALVAVAAPAASTDTAAGR
jgi:soluble lytic murein transglycosylase-like protein